MGSERIPWPKKIGRAKQKKGRCVFACCVCLDDSELCVYKLGVGEKKKDWAARGMQFD